MSSADPLHHRRRQEPDQAAGGSADRLADPARTHLNNLFEDKELDPAATVKDSLTVQIEGAREAQRPVNLYNLDAILAVGYRVRTPRGVQFRRMMRS